MDSIETRSRVLFLAAGIAAMAIVCEARASDTVGSPVTWNAGSPNGNTTSAQGDVSEERLTCILKNAGTMLGDLKKMSNDSNFDRTPVFSEQKAEEAGKAFAAAFAKLESNGVAQNLSHNCLMQLLSFSIEESGLDGTNVQKNESREKTGSGYIQITGGGNFTGISSCTGSAESIESVSASATSSALAAVCFFDQNYVKNKANKDICDNSNDTSGQTKMLALMNSGHVDGNCTDRASGKQMKCTEATEEVRRRLSTFQMVDQASVKCPTN